MVKVSTVRRQLLLLLFGGEDLKVLHYMIVQLFGSQWLCFMHLSVQAQKQVQSNSTEISECILVKPLWING